MQNSLSLTADQPVTMTTREIAELVEKRHDNVMRTLETLYENGVIGLPQFEEVPNLGAGPLLLKQYRVGKRDSFVLVAQLSPQFTARIVDRWQELESSVKLPVELSRMQILEIAMEAEKGRILAIEQRDEAIRTKAQISDKKTATAMATASAKSREVARLKHELGRSQEHATVIAVERASGRKFEKTAYVALRRVTAEYGMNAVSVKDDRYGSVKAWPAIAWREVYGIDLDQLFPGEQS